MASSGSINFDQTRAEIIKDAMLTIGAIEAGETPSAEESDDAGRALNRMVKAWQADGIHLWTWREATLFFVKGQTSYSLGSGGADATLSSVKTELSTAGVATDLTIEVDSITGIANADNIGTELDDGTIHWTTVNGAPSGTTVTITVALPSAAAVDNHVYAYTTKIDRPLRVTNVRRRDEAEQDIPILTFSRQEYFDTPNKTTQSKTTEVYYDPKLSLGVLYTWPTAESVKDRLLFDAAFPIEDFDAAGDNPDFPQEWLDALVFGLASRIASQFGVPIDERRELRAEANGYKEAVRGWDKEPEPALFQPDLSPGGWED